jgi:hypothetical protein
MQHARHELKTVLDPMIDPLQEKRVAIERSFQVPLGTLSFNSHAEDIRCPLQEGDIVLAKVLGCPPNSSCVPSHTLRFGRLRCSAALSSRVLSEVEQAVFSITDASRWCLSAS